MKTVDLNGVWELSCFGGQRGMAMKHAEMAGLPGRMKMFEARVPGEVHWDLLRAGVIGDPYVGLGSLECRWVEEMMWSYRREFEVPGEAVGKGVRSWLVFEGLDLVAKIVLNGEVVGGHKNVFYPCRVDVTGKLRAGKNVVAVHLDAGLFEVADKWWKGWWGFRGWGRTTSCISGCGCGSRNVSLSGTGRHG